MAGARLKALLTAAFSLLCTVLMAQSVMAGPFDSSVAWPLCGRISEQPPAGWTVGDNCPSDRFGDPAFSDEPLSSTFGPRPLYSEAGRYDFHRGLDIASPVGTPFFAVSEGTVQIAGIHPAYSDPLVSVRHVRPGQSGCEPLGCYTTLYLHVSDWVVGEGEDVAKGQLLGFTGASSSGFEHLHFEVRDAPSFDPYSAWSRDAVHPLRLLPYRARPEARFIVVTEPPFDLEPLEFTLTSRRYDLLSIDLEVLDFKGRPVAQAGDHANVRGYHVHPPFFDMDTANFEYSHKDSSAFPWSSFGDGGTWQCPYAADHGASYSAHVHLDAQDPGDEKRGLFNGIGVRTLRYWPSDEGEYEIGLTFHELAGPIACVEFTATYHSGPPAFGQAGQCHAANGQRATLRIKPLFDGVRLRWKSANPAKAEIYRNGILAAQNVEGGQWTDLNVVTGGRYRYRVCPGGNNANCSRSRVITLPR